MSQAALTQKQTTATDTTFDQMPAELDSGNAKLVYLYLETVEEATIEDLQATLDVKQLALFPTLATLEAKDLVERNGETFTIAA